MNKERQAGITAEITEAGADVADTVKESVAVVAVVGAGGRGASPRPNTKAASEEPLPPPPTPLSSSSGGSSYRPKIARCSHCGFEDVLGPLEGVLGPVCRTCARCGWEN